MACLAVPPQLSAGFPAQVKLQNPIQIGVLNAGLVIVDPGQH
jgi:hypothetical protein